MIPGSHLSATFHHFILHYILLLY